MANIFFRVIPRWSAGVGQWCEGGGPPHSPRGGPSAIRYGQSLASKESAPCDGRGIRSSCSANSAFVGACSSVREDESTRDQQRSRYGKDRSKSRAKAESRGFRGKVAKGDVTFPQNAESRAGDAPIFGRNRSGSFDPSGSATLYFRHRRRSFQTVQRCCGRSYRRRSGTSIHRDVAGDGTECWVLRPKKGMRLFGSLLLEGSERRDERGRVPPNF